MSGALVVVLGPAVVVLVVVGAAVVVLGPAVVLVVVVGPAVVVLVVVGRAVVVLVVVVGGVKLAHAERSTPMRSPCARWAATALGLTHWNVTGFVRSPVT